MYIITRKSPTIPDLDLFYRFSQDETNLFCHTDSLEKSKKYTEEEKTRLETNNMLCLCGVEFKKLKLSF